LKYEKRKIRILEHWFHVYALYKSTLTLTHTTWSTMALVNSSDSNYNTSVSMPHFKMYASATECIWSYYDLELWLRIWAFDWHRPRWPWM